MSDADLMRLALRLARRGYGTTSPNPMVGAILVKRGRIIGRGWHQRAGGPHAEVMALRDAQRRGESPAGADLYVTLEPCSTQGRTPPCTQALIDAGIQRVVVGATDPNPRHAGAGLRLLRRSGLTVGPAVLALECGRLNEAFNHWIVHQTPWVTVKAAMTLDGKIATASGESRWITGAKARAYGMKMRQGSDAILVGINTVLADDPSLTFRPRTAGSNRRRQPELRRIVLDSLARTPLSAAVVGGTADAPTTIVVSRRAPRRRVAALARAVEVLEAPVLRGRLDLPWLLKKLGAAGVTSLLVEGGGEINASFLLGGLAQRVVFFYAPLVLGGCGSRPAVAGEGINREAQILQLSQVQWRHLGEDLMLTARVGV